MSIWRERFSGATTAPEDGKHILLAAEEIWMLFDTENWMIIIYFHFVAISGNNYRTYINAHIRLTSPRARNMIFSKLFHFQFHHHLSKSAYNLLFGRPQNSISSEYIQCAQSGFSLCNRCNACNKFPHKKDTKWR